MDCTEQIYSNEYYDFIVDNNAYGAGYEQSLCQSNIENIFTIEYKSVNDTLPLSVKNYDYSSIPKCFCLVGENALEATGIPRVWNQPSLGLQGQGVLMGFIDTGIDYQLDVFQDSAGNSRIAGIWDQTIRQGNPPSGYEYGTEYTTQMINEALANDNPLEIVPTRDENGHGTYVASIAAAGENGNGTFSGGAPRCDIAMVKLKEAKDNLKAYFYANNNAGNGENPIYSECDIMTAVNYLDDLAEARNQPLVICIALGTFAGSHGGNNPLSIYLDIMATRASRCVVCATGNEAARQHHYYGNITDSSTYLEVEIQVGARIAGFTMEQWAIAPQLFEVSLVSPTGDVFPKTAVQRGVSSEYTFIFENTTVAIDYRTPESATGNQLIFFRFSNPAAGIWRIRVFLRNATEGSFHMYLPMQCMLEGEVYFLRANPDTTIVTPANAIRTLTVGGYNDTNDSIYIDSGRGYTLDGHIKPDIVAPAVDITGISANSSNRPEFLSTQINTGTCAAAAFASAAAALFMEWGIVQLRETTINTTEVKNFLIRGTRQRTDELYPNRQWGYGILDLYRAFEQLRNIS